MYFVPCLLRRRTKYINCVLRQLMFETFYTDGLDGYAIQKFSNLSHTFCFEVETGHKEK